MKNRIWIVLCLILTLATPASSEVRASEGIASSFNTVSAGLNYSCMVDSSNVLCWGDNLSGQLGDDTLVPDRYTPVFVVEQAGSTNPLSGVVSVSAGWFHSCALMSTGRMKCWGYNYNGQLGDDTTETRRAPVDVKDPIDPSGFLTNVTAISTGWNYTCALISGGAIKCWGANGFGKLGNGNNTTDSHTPIDVNNLAGSAIAVTAGQVHTCAVLATGFVQCWGYNGFGQLGDGTYTNSPIPVTVSGLTGVSAIATGFHHTCAVTTGGSLACWGRNEFGQLGNNSITTSPLPVSVVDQFNIPLSNIETVSAGFSHSCARSLDGAAYCWGLNLLGQLGDGSYTNRSVAEPVFEINFGYVALASGQHHSCAKNNSGGVKCWGYNIHGQLGNDSIDSSNVPVCVVGFCFDPVPIDRTITLNAPYDNCTAISSHSPSPQPGDSKVLSQGFSVATASCDASVGSFQSHLTVFGGNKNPYNLFEKKNPPAQEAQADTAIVAQYTPDFTGNLQIKVNLTINGKEAAAAGSGLVTSINVGDEIGDGLVDWLTGKQISKLLDILNTLVKPTLASGGTDVYLRISGGASGEITDTLAEVASVFPYGPYSQTVSFENQSATLLITVPVTEGQTIDIVVGAKTRAQTWGWASVYVNLGDPAPSVLVDSIELTKP